MDFSVWLEDEQTDEIQRAIVACFPPNFKPDTVLTTDLNRIDLKTKGNIQQLGIVATNPHKNDIVMALKNPHPGMKVMDLVTMLTGKGQPMPPPSQQAGS